MLLYYLGLLIHKNQVRMLDDIRSAEEFRAILHRERSRSNRNGHVFSLVVFDLQEVNADSALVRRLAHVLSYRMRATDEIGWLDDAHIGIILLYTAADAAWKVPDDVCRMIGTGTLSFSYKVYTYPSRGTPSSDVADLECQFSHVSP